MSTENQLTVKKGNSNLSIFSDISLFENAQRMAQVLVKSSLVPAAYKGNIPNAMIALEMANRIGISPFMVMQNLDIIQGKPSWSSSFTIAALNSCGRFTPLKFEFSGEKDTDDYGCSAWAMDNEGNKLIGPKVDWKMVNGEGWSKKNGSKWKTMPELMFHYRSASFFGRLYAPDILKGMHSAEEIIDMATVDNVVMENEIDKEEQNRALSFIENAPNLEKLQEVRDYAESVQGDLFEKYQAKEEQLKS